MKRHLTLYINLFLIVNCFSQTFRNGHDIHDYHMLNKGQGKTISGNSVPSSYTTNLKADLNNSENWIMEAYINLFKSTNDKKYLNQFIIHAKRVQERRDDNIINISVNETDIPRSPSGCSFTLHSNNQNTLSSEKSWSYVENNCDWSTRRVLYSGNLTFPMAQFVHLILVEKSADYNFITTPLPNEAKTLPSNSNCPIQAMDNYYHFASWLKCRIEETISFHDSFWRKRDMSGNFVSTSNPCLQPIHAELCYGSTTIVCNGGPGAYVHDESSNNVDALNMQCAMGRTLVVMYAVNGNNNYLCKIRDIAVGFKNQMSKITTSSLPSSLPQASLGYVSWCHSYDCKNNEWEDIDHGFTSIQFADLCYSYGLKYYNGQDLFTLNDMKKFGNLAAYILYKNPGEYFMNVMGHNYNCEPEYCLTDGNNVPSGVNLADRYYLGGLYASISKYNPYIYQQCVDLYDSRALYQNQWDYPLPFSYLAMAQSPYFQWNSSWSSNFKFNPIGVNTYGNSHNFKGGTIGDFDNNGSNEIILYDATRDHFRLYSVGKYSTAPSDVTLELTFSGTGNAINLASGDINSFHAGEEFITINPNNSTIYLYEQNGTSFSAITQQISGSSSWKSLAVGDFDVGHQGDEIFALDNNGDIYLLVYDYQTQSFGVYNKGNISVASGVSITSGNFDPNNSNVQFATVENGSGHIKIFEYNTSTNSLNTTPLYTYTASGTGNQWRTMTSGDFDEDGVDELIAYRHYDGQVMMFKVKNGQLPLVYSEYFPKDQEIAVLISGKFNQFLGGDVFTVLRNYDGKLALFTMEGQCPGVSLQNTLVDGTYTIDNNYSGSQNNYVIDYHANNTLMASNNFTIVTPSEVEFTAGKKVILKPGFKALAGSKFHAYIDNQLACNMPYLRTGNTSPTENNDPELKQQIKEAFNFKVFPNPNTGNFTVYLEESNQTQTVTILNMLGEKVSQINTLEQKLEINLVSYPKGVYFVNVQSDKGSKSKKIVIN